MPIGSRGRFKTLARAAIEPRHARRIEEHNLFAVDRIRMMEQGPDRFAGRILDRASGDKTSDYIGRGQFMTDREG